MSSSAKRVGWIECNILIENLPLSGKIFYIREGRRYSEEKIVGDFAKVNFLRDSSLIKRSWLLDVMKQIESLDKKRFSLTEIYERTKILQKLHPEHHNIRAKISQQLQILRDKNYLLFITPGIYELL